MKVIKKDCYREIKKNYKRFISLLLMAFLGVGFFVGIRAVSPGLRYSVDKYYDRTKMFDIKLLSTAGFNEKEIAKIGNAVGGYSLDTIISANKEEQVSKVISINEKVNKLEIKEGRMPENDSECVLEFINVKTEKIKIGDTIFLDNTDEFIKYKNTELKVVGFVYSPLYISLERGTSKLGSGKVSFVTFVPESNFDADYYTEAYIHEKNLEKYALNSNSYQKKLTPLKEKTKKIAKTLAAERQQEIDEEINSEIEEANQKIEDGDAELEKAKNDLKQLEAYLAYNPALQATVNEARSKIEEAEDELEDAKIELDKIKKEIAELKPVKWYVFDRKENVNYNGFLQDTDSIANVGKVFPLVFFLIAILICLTSMTRMIEEERTEIGT